MERIAVPPIEAAQALGISKSTLERRIADGSIRAVKLGRRVVVPVAELHRLIDQGAA